MSIPLSWLHLSIYASQSLKESRHPLVMTVHITLHGVGFSWASWAINYDVTVSALIDECFTQLHPAIFENSMLVSWFCVDLVEEEFAINLLVIGILEHADIRGWFRGEWLNSQILVKFSLQKRSNPAWYIDENLSVFLQVHFTLSY